MIVFIPVTDLVIVMQINYYYYYYYSLINVSDKERTLTPVVKVRVNAFPHLLFSASVVPPPGFKC